MKGSIFVDTSAWYALISSGDRNHPLASEFLPNALIEFRELVSTNLVIGETYTLVTSRLGYDAAWRFLRQIRKSPRLRRVFVTEELEMKAYDFLESRTDQRFSFVDGTSFAVMKAQGISSCFAFDRHFGAAGFTALPSST